MKIVILLLLVSMVSCTRQQLRPPTSKSTDKSRELSKGLKLSCASKEIKYKGFGGVDLTVGRVSENDIPEDGDRFRIKPFSSMMKDFERIFGSVPSSLIDNEGSFSAPKERWYIEPSVSAVSLFSTYRAAYQGGLAYASSQNFGDISEDEATKVCLSITKVAWLKTASKEDIEACIDFAMNKTSGSTDERWAHVIATIITSTGFIAY